MAKVAFRVSGTVPLNTTLSTELRQFLLIGYYSSSELEGSFEATRSVVRANA